MSLYQKTGKRLLDVSLAALGLLILWPILLVVSVVILLMMGRPILFRQGRPGLHGQPFEILKFRTMREADAGSGSPENGKRLTPCGRWLRRWSLDELPELVNVLRGEMSLVGPRPLLLEYLGRYSAEQMRRHSVLPGITGWAQVNGRNAVTWEERFELDLWYVDHVGLTLDLRILGRTLGHVLRGRGISAPGSATMPKFDGDAE